MSPRPEWIDDDVAELVEQHLGRAPTEWEWAQIDEQADLAMQNVLRLYASAAHIEPGEGK